jgi:hypothetical protein
MITENSSLANEFLLLDRPVIYNHVSIEKFFAIAKPVIEDMELLFPGDIFNTSAGFYKALQSAVDHPQKYHEKRIKTRKIFHQYTDGKSCERLFNLMQNFTPVENMDYDMFTLPVKEEKEREIKEKEQEIEDKRQRIKEKEQEIEEIKNSRKYRYASLFVKYVCPQGSVRRRFTLKIIKILHALN